MMDAVGIFLSTSPLFPDRCMGEFRYMAGALRIGPSSVDQRLSHSSAKLDRVLSYTSVYQVGSSLPMVKKSSLNIHHGKSII